jgi:hypothetical protein
MKATFFNRIILLGAGLILFAVSVAQAQLPFKPLGESPASHQEEQELTSLFATVHAATASITPGPDAGYHYGERFYDPNTQRWPNRDPFIELGFQELLSPDIARPRHSHDGNAYTFVMNTPENDTDAWGLTPTFKGCRQKEIDAINKTLTDDCKKAQDCGKKCRSKEGQSAAASGVDKICNGNPTINCVGKDFVFSDGGTCKGLCGKTRGGNEMFLCPSAFTSPGCGRPMCTVLHESLHWGGLPGDSKTKHPMDFSDFENCMGCPPKGGL